MKRDKRKRMKRGLESEMVWWWRGWEQLGCNQTNNSWRRDTRHRWRIFKIPWIRDSVPRPGYCCLQLLHPPCKTHSWSSSTITAFISWWNCLETVSTLKLRRAGDRRMKVRPSSFATFEASQYMRSLSRAGRCWPDQTILKLAERVIFTELIAELKGLPISTEPCNISLELSEQAVLVTSEVLSEANSSFRVLAWQQRWNFWEGHGKWRRRQLIRLSMLHRTFWLKKPTTSNSLFSLSL